MKLLGYLVVLGLVFAVPALAGDDNSYHEHHHHENFGERFLDRVFPPSYYSF